MPKIQHGSIGARSTFFILKKFAILEICDIIGMFSNVKQYIRLLNNYRVIGGETEGVGANIEKNKLFSLNS